MAPCIFSGVVYNPCGFRSILGQGLFSIVKGITYG